MFIGDEDIIVIPARKGSKGIPHKNRDLIEHTLHIIPPHYKDKVYIYTNDEVIQNRYKGQYNIIDRSESVSKDETSTKETLTELFKVIKKNNGNCIMLYTVYPERKWKEVEDIYYFYQKNNGKTLLCCKHYNEIHPYLLIRKNGINGEQLIPHNLYRRQDYPKVFQISHYVTIFEIGELNNLNENLYNEQTVYFELKDNIIDIDTEKDVLLWKKEKKLK
jgi:CMP-N-acetylneuraminic acid synthetase